MLYKNQPLIERWKINSCFKEKVIKGMKKVSYFTFEKQEFHALLSNEAETFHSLSSQKALFHEWFLRSHPFLGFYVN